MKRVALVLLTLALGGAPSFAAEAGKLDVNKATEKELLALPEMTEARAKAILSYRQGNGELIQLEELKVIPQVAPIYDKIKDRLTVE